MFCIKCGSELQEVLIDNRQRKRCKVCGWVFYPQLKVGTAGIITDNGKVLLLLRSQEPWKDFWNLPAGYVDDDENPQFAVKREIEEETGLLVSDIKLFNVYFFNDDPRGNGILIVYQCSTVVGELKLNFENSDFRYFMASEIPENLCGAGHKKAILDWKQLNED